MLEVWKGVKSLDTTGKGTANAGWPNDRLFPQPVGFPSRSKKRLCEELNLPEGAIEEWADNHSGNAIEYSSQNLKRR